VGHRFSLGCIADDDRLCGAAIVGRPIARLTSQYDVAEITRLVTDGTYNACSKLYGACARVAKEMGFKSIQTFILDSENGSSLKASGYVLHHHSPGGDWTSTSKPNRRQDQPMVPKQLWVKILNADRP
jgi:hypothetical protein